jgi:hypothetical protein
LFFFANPKNISISDQNREIAKKISAKLTGFTAAKAAIGAIAREVSPARATILPPMLEVKATGIIFRKEMRFSSIFG